MRDHLELEERVCRGRVSRVRGCTRQCTHSADRSTLQLRGRTSESRDEEEFQVVGFGVRESRVREDECVLAVFVQTVPDLLGACGAGTRGAEAMHAAQERRGGRARTSVSQTRTWFFSRTTLTPFGAYSPAELTTPPTLPLPSSATRPHRRVTHRLTLALLSFPQTPPFYNVRVVSCLRTTSAHVATRPRRIHRVPRLVRSRSPPRPPPPRTGRRSSASAACATRLLRSLSSRAARTSATLLRVRLISFRIAF